jgi:peroxidase
MNKLLMAMPFIFLSLGCVNTNKTTPIDNSIKDEVLISPKVREKLENKVLIAEQKKIPSIFPKQNSMISAFEGKILAGGFPPLYGNGGGGKSKTKHKVGIHMYEVRTMNGVANHPENFGMAAAEDEENQNFRLPQISLPHDFFDSTTKIISSVSPTIASGLSRVMMHQYLDDGDTPKVTNLPHPRLVSNTIFAQSESIPSPMNLSHIIFFWGQFLDHDISIAPLSIDDSFSISPYPDDMAKDGIPFFRSEKIPGSGRDKDTPRMQFNLLTSFIDASQVYGSSDQRAAWLRTHNGGKLKTSIGNLLPFGEADGSSPPMSGLNENENLISPADLFVAGDVRANETLFLLAMHTLFVREHNRLVKEIRSKSGETNDELLFQAARKIVGALVQSITYNEFLPALGVELPPYVGYKEQADPRTLNIFATAGFRLGHTMLADNIPIKNVLGEVSLLPLFKAFFAPSLFTEENFLGILRGGISHKAERIDNKIVDGVRNFLFGSKDSKKGLDLAMINIQRARDHGLPKYMQMRKMFDGESKITSENENLLLTIYPSLEEVEIWVGMLNEPEMPGKTIGQTIYDILSLQFTALRDGDRFFYLNDPDFVQAPGLSSLGYDVSYIENRTLDKIIADNIAIEQDKIPTNVFFVGE